MIKNDNEELDSSIPQGYFKLNSINKFLIEFI